MRHPVRIPAPLVALLGVLLWFVSPAAAQAGRVPDVRPAVERIDVVPGRPLVLPVDIVDERVLRRGVFEAVLDDGLKITGELYWIGARVTPRDGWLGPVVEWSATPAREAIVQPTRDPGRWYLVCDMPNEAVGLGMWFAGERSAVNWLPDPWRLGRDAAARVPEAMWAGTLPEDAAQSEEIRRTLARLLRNPWTRWRARLMLGELEPDGSFGDHWSLPPGFDVSMPTGVIGKLAWYQDGLWQAALARLWVGDEREATALRVRLGQVSAFEGGWAATFPVSSVEEHDLRTDLLNPFVSESTLAIRANAWQLSQPAAAVWTVDDSGRTDARSGSPVATVGVVALGAGETATLLSLEGKAPEPIERTTELRRVLTGTATGSTEATGGLAAERVPVRVGSWRTEVGVVRGVRAARPPGVAMGPLVRDWTLEPWLQGREMEGAAVSSSSLTSAKLFRRGRGMDEWCVQVECRTPTDGPDGEDEVTLWFGPRGSPSVVRRVNSRGEVRARAGERVLEVVDVARTPSGWTVVVGLPAEAIEPGGVVRLGITRLDASGVRTAWPRRMLPWDTEPGRLAISLKAWDGF